LNGGTLVTRRLDGNLARPVGGLSVSGRPQQQVANMLECGGVFQGELLDKRRSTGPFRLGGDEAGCRII
jgi:hypothetical protein